MKEYLTSTCSCPGHHVNQSLRRELIAVVVHAMDDRRLALPASDQIDNFVTRTLCFANILRERTSADSLRDIRQAAPWKRGGNFWKKSTNTEENNETHRQEEETKCPIVLRTSSYRVKCGGTPAGWYRSKAGKLACLCVCVSARVQCHYHHPHLVAHVACSIPFRKTRMGSQETADVGRWRKIVQLGSGRTGDVALCIESTSPPTHASKEKTCGESQHRVLHAVKRVRRQCTTNSGAVQRILQEKKALEALRGVSGITATQQGACFVTVYIAKGQLLLTSQQL